MRILCIDDDPVFLKVVQSNLAAQGYRDVSCVQSGAAALTLLHDPAQEFDCFLVDIQMPGMDGIEVTRAIRSIGRFARTPIVMVTKMSEKTFVDMAFAAGATDFVTKPLDVLEFKSRISMIQQLANERAKNAALVAQTNPFSQGAVTIGLHDPVLIPELENSVEYLALENYLLTLGKARLSGTVAMAVRFQEVRQIHSLCNSTDYVDILTEIGLELFDSLKSHEFLISYAGDGVFMIFFTGRVVLDTKELQETLNQNLSAHASFWGFEHIPPATLKVGQPVSATVFSTGNPTRMLQRAIRNVEGEAVSVHNFKRLLSA